MKVPTVDEAVADTTGQSRAITILDAWLRAEDARATSLDAAAASADGGAEHCTPRPELVGRRDWTSLLEAVPASIRPGLLGEWWESECLTRRELRSMLPRVWIAGEPDDADPLWLGLFAAAASVGRLEDEPLPEGDPLTIYRAGTAAMARGTRAIGWSLSRDVAVFRALDVPRPAEGLAVVVEASVPRRAVLAYMTNDNEALVIVVPTLVDVLAVRPVAEDRTEHQETSAG